MSELPDFVVGDNIWQILPWDNRVVENIITCKVTREFLDASGAATRIEYAHSGGILGLADVSPSDWMRTLFPTRELAENALPAAVAEYCDRERAQVEREMEELKARIAELSTESGTVKDESIEPKLEG